MSSTRVTLVANGKHHVGKVAVLPGHEPTLDSIKQAGKNKLRLNVRRLFTKSGVELLSCDDVRQHVTPGSTIVCSSGEEFSGKQVNSKKATGNGPADGAASFVGRSEARVELLAVRTHVDEDAVRQLQRTAASYPTIVAAAGMPDLHPGNSFPIGAAFYVRNEILPFLVGNDVGCGMALWMTSLHSGKARQRERWAKRLESLKDEVRVGREEAELSSPIDCRSGAADFAHQLGTIGGGNHFAELQVVEEVVDDEKFTELGLRDSTVYLLVHSGSRAFGQSILEKHTACHGTSGLAVSSEDGQQYLREHDAACSFARRNRREIARRLLTALQSDLPDVPVLDIFHNNVAEVESADAGKVWLHRKGAAPMDQGPVVIPGSRGAPSYLVVPTADESKRRRALYSVAHGAGRKWTRAKANAVGKQRFPRASELRISPGGSYVVCKSTALLYEEQPDAYKDVTSIIADLAEQGLVHVVAVFKPILTYKD